MSDAVIEAKPPVKEGDKWLHVPISFDLLLEGNGIERKELLVEYWPLAVSTLLVQELVDGIKRAAQDPFLETQLSVAESGLPPRGTLQTFTLFHPKDESLRKNIAPAPREVAHAFNTTQARKSGLMRPNETFALGLGALVSRRSAFALLLEATLMEVEFEFGSLSSKGKLLLKLSPTLGPLLLYVLGVFATPLNPTKPVEKFILRREIQADLRLSHEDPRNCRVTGAAKIDASDLVKKFQEASDGHGTTNLCPVQYALHALKHSPGKLDGKYGAHTQVAISAFGLSRKLPPDAYLPEKATPNKMHLSPLFYEQLARALAGEPPPP